VFEDRADWPVPGTADLDAYLWSGAAPQDAGSLALGAGGPLDSRTFTDANLSESNYIGTPTGSQANRLVFLSPPLERDLRISGTPTVELRASSANRTQSNLTALLVDYGTGTYVTRSGEGISTPADAPETCWGLTSPTDEPCYREITKNTTTVPQWRVTKGMLDSSNRDSLTTASPMTLGTEYTFRWPLLPNDFTFAAGHRIGVVIGANFSQYGSVNGMTGATVTVSTKRSKLSLPAVGGPLAALGSGGFGPHVAGLGAGTSLEDKAAEIQASAAAGRAKETCNGLGALVRAVAAQRGRSLTEAEAEAVTAETKSIATAVGC
jgi:X-Pro dipeptidyl-peptidase